MNVNIMYGNFLSNYYLIMVMSKCNEIAFYFTSKSAQDFYDEIYSIAHRSPSPAMLIAEWLRVEFKTLFLQGVEPTEKVYEAVVNMAWLRFTGCEKSEVNND